MKNIINKCQEIKTRPNFVNWYGWYIKTLTKREKSNRIYSVSASLYLCYTQQHDDCIKENK